MSRMDDMLIMKMNGEEHLWDAQMEIEKAIKPILTEFCKSHGIKACRVIVDVTEIAHDETEKFDPVVYWR